MKKTIIKDQSFSTPKSKQVNRTQNIKLNHNSLNTLITKNNKTSITSLTSDPSHTPAYTLLQKISNKKSTPKTRQSNNIITINTTQKGSYFSDYFLEEIVAESVGNKYSPATFNRLVPYMKKAAEEAQLTTYKITSQEPPAESLYRVTETTASKKSSDTETMNLQEAKDTLTGIQYAQVTGSQTNIDLQERRRFANWAQYNPEFLSLFHKINSLTNDVDYSKTF